MWRKKDAPARFAGWVPTIAGQLSFSLIGLRATAPGCLAANVEFDCPKVGHPRRHVAVLQRRVTKDWAATFWPISLLFRRIAPHYLMIGETGPAERPVLSPTAKDGITTRRDEIGVLKGHVFLIPNDQFEQRSVSRLLKKLKKMIAEAADEAPRDGITSDGGLLDRIRADIADFQTQGLVVQSAFELYRTGEFRLTFETTGVVAPEDQLDFEDLISGQMYYFAKDMAHRHFHHDRANDNLLPFERAPDTDDEGWRRETLWSMTRAVLEMRRRNRLDQHKKAIGILAYADAFQNLLARVKRGPGGKFVPTQDLALYDFEHTRQSINSTIDEISSRYSLRITLWNGILAVLLGTPALWFAAIQIGSNICPKTDLNCPGAAPDWAIWMVKTFITHPHYGLIYLLLLSSTFFEGSRAAISRLPLLADYERLLSGWIDATGASASKFIRRVLPEYGDQLGSIASWITICLFVTMIYALVGGATHLWPWPPIWILGLWVFIAIVFIMVWVGARLIHGARPPNPSGN